MAEKLVKNRIGLWLDIFLNNLGTIIFVISFAVLLLFCLNGIYNVFVPVSFQSGANQFSFKFPLGLKNGHCYFSLLSLAIIKNLFYGILTLLTFLVFGLLMGVGNTLEPDRRGMIDKKGYVILYLSKISYWTSYGVTQLLQSVPLPIFLLTFVILVQVSSLPVSWRMPLNMLILGFLLSPRLSESFAAQVKMLRRFEFMDTARSTGMSLWRLYGSHIIHYQMGRSFYMLLLQVPFYSLMYEIFLSYLNYGDQNATIGLFIKDSIQLLPSEIILISQGMPMSIRTLQLAIPLIIIAMITINLLILRNRAFKEKVIY
jgi:hypothetical protein